MNHDACREKLGRESGSVAGVLGQAVSTTVTLVLRLGLRTIKSSAKRPHPPQSIRAGSIIAKPLLRGERKHEAAVDPRLR
jgi:hypothetical protein